MSHALNKRQKIEQIYQILRDYPDGLTQSELARKLDVYPSTIKKYLDQGDLPYVYEEEGSKRLKLNPDIHLFRLGFSFDEITMLHIAARLLVRQTNQHNPYAASALRKLAEVIEKADQNISQHLASAASQTDSQEQILNKEFVTTLHVLTEARTKGRKVTLEYELDDGQWLPYTFAPYFIEPYAPGLTTHVIGKREPPGAIRTFKVERLRNARLTHEDFVIDPDFDPQSLLEHAWGIWYADKSPELVELKFAPRVKRRVLETRWHRHQAEPEVLVDDSVLWRCRIAEPKEMLYWIRGWGADVEVMKPDWLKAELKLTAEALAEKYEVTEAMSTTAGEIPGYRLLWAKADKRTYQIHRLIYHMIDVGQSALALWQSALPAILKHRVADWLHLSIDDTGRLLAFWASLHDLGKASPAFQDHTNIPKPVKARVLRELKNAGLEVDKRGSEPHARHEVISAWSLRTVQGEGLLAELTRIDSELAEYAAQMLGGHHGAFPTSNKFGPNHLRGADKGNESWLQARDTLVQALITIFRPPDIAGFSPSSPEDNTLMILLAAIVSAADWLGSDDQNFPLEADIIPLPAYVRHARHHAQLALLRAAWKPAPLLPRLDFKKTFGFERNAAQTEIHAALQPISLPALIIIEGPMGSGKTEAALDTAAYWMRRANLNGCYIAMPTTATSNQMHERVTQFLQSQLGADIEPLLVHSQALLQRPAQFDHDDENNVAQDDEADDGTVEEEGHSGDSAAGQSWFLPRKKSLLAPFGVGTVDQALMSVLQTKHFFVRLLGLSNKAVIFDEVHAYDAYMSVLFERLLTWLRHIGASVVVLSATLPAKTRNDLVKAYTGATPSNVEVRYPRVTIAPVKESSQILPLTPPDPKHLGYGWMAYDTQCVVEQLRKALRNGGCAAVICNTVKRAQEIYRVIKQANEDADETKHLCDAENTILFHARFPMAWREAIEEKVLRKFGPNREDKANPNPQRPGKAIVVATQVIEQSLDLDFDVMISDHAPIDLLLQRAGRLQRHKANGLERAHPFCLWLCEPEVVDDLPKFTAADKLVYDEFILLRSWLALKERQRKQIDLPGDLAMLIEQVYGNEPLVIPTEALQSTLDKAWRSLLADRIAMQDLAEERLVREPSYPHLLTRPNMELDEDDPKTPAAFQALTRSDRPGLNVVCLHRFSGKLYTDIAGKGAVYDYRRKPTSDLIKELARASVTIRRPNIEESLMAPTDAESQRILSKWRKIAALRYHRVAIFDNGICRLKGISYVLQLSHEFGLEIHKEDE